MRQFGGSVNVSPSATGTMVVAPDSLYESGFTVTLDDTAEGRSRQMSASATCSYARQVSATLPYLPQSSFGRQTSWLVQRLSY
jgi:dienelactone hydrolase